MLFCQSGSITPASAQIIPDLLSGKFKARGIVTTFYSSEDQTRLLTISAKKIYADHERRGFFKIGILPIAVFEDASVEIEDPARVQEAFTQLDSWLGPGACKRVELRRFTLRSAGSEDVKLECGRARFERDGQLKFQDGVSVSIGTNNASAPSALLQITGRKSGTLQLSSTPAVPIDLFRGNTTEETTQRKAHP